MSPRAVRNFGIFLVFIVLIDLYAYKGINTAFGNHSLIIRRIARFVYWAISIGIIGVLAYTILTFNTARRDHSYLFSLVALFLLFFLPKLVIVIFHGLDDLLNLGRLGVLKMLPSRVEGHGEIFSRTRFLSQLGLILATVPFAGVLYGVTKGRRTFNIAQVPIKAKKLPAAFAGLKVVQISDMHLGSYGDDLSIVKNGIELINEQEPDLIFFTGDLVNDFATEAEPFIEAVSQLKAKLGKYSILGNHDYSDYTVWADPQAKVANLDRLKAIHKEMGFRLLLDENLPIEKNGESIGLVGVQNWGKSFQKYGDLKKAIKGSEHYPFRILLSHDPTHWDLQVKGTGIDLTLSGHTHGAQLGVKLGHTTYSPAQWVYKQWAGLYSDGEQSLYVNRGFGFIGFPGRVGMPPEITVFELKRV